MLAVLTIINIVILLKSFEIAYIINDLGQTSPALGVPMAAVYLAAPIGMSIAVLRAVQASVRLWRGDNTLITSHEEDVL